MIFGILSQNFYFPLKNFVFDMCISHNHFNKWLFFAF